MDWIHCNKCFYTKTSPQNIPLFCGSCCHIICKNCLQKKCPVCQKQFNYTEITDKITPKAPNVVHSYLEDLNAAGQNLQKRAKFQYEQRIHLEKQQLKIFDSIKKTKIELIELQKIEKLLEAKIREDMIVIQKYRSFIERIRRSKANMSARRNISKHSLDNLRSSFSSVNSGPPITKSKNKDDSGFSGFNSTWIGNNN